MDRLFKDVRNLYYLIRYPVTKRQRLIRVASFWMLPIVIFLILDLIYQVFGLGIPCPARTVTGLLCPGCGTFRAIGALLRLDIWQAVRYNAFTLILLPILIVLCIRESTRYIKAATPPHMTGRLDLLISVVIAMIGILFTIVRNLPFMAVLQPTAI